MITSNKQYLAAQKQLSMLTKSSLSPIREDIPLVIEKANRQQLKELINEIQLSINEYEALKNGTLADIEIHSMEDLMKAPIRYRLTTNMSVDAFSRKVGISARQIARYEIENYQNTNSRTLQKIISMLDIRLEGKVA